MPHNAINAAQNVDYTYWARMRQWTSNEAAALTLGLSPDLALMISRDQRFRKPPLIDEFEKLSTLIQRSAVASPLHGSDTNASRMGTSNRPIIRPIAHLEWCSQANIAPPDALTEQVTRYHGDIPDWRAKYEEASRERDSLRVVVKQLEQRAGFESLPTRERYTMLKLIIGMAIGGYGYDPAASKSSAVKDISDDLALRGINLAANTIRDKLREGAELLSQEGLPAH